MLKFTVFLVQINDLEGVLSIADNVVVGLIPSCDSSQFGPRKSSKRVQHETIEDESDHVYTKRSGDSLPRCCLTKSHENVHTGASGSGRGIAAGVNRESLGRDINGCRC